MSETTGYSDEEKASQLSKEDRQKIKQLEKQVQRLEKENREIKKRSEKEKEAQEQSGKFEKEKPTEPEPVEEPEEDEELPEGLEEVTIENCFTYALSDDKLNRVKVTETIEHLKAVVIEERTKRFKAENLLLKEKCKYLASQVLPEVK